MKQIALTYVIIFTAIFTLPTIANEKTVTACIEDSFWAPHTFFIGNEPSGIHVEMLKYASTKLPYKLKFRSAPWQRCIKWTTEGHVDLLLSAGYSEQRSKVFFFPEGAGRVGPHPFRITQGEEVLVVTSNSPYSWSGDLDTLPTPIGSKVGYRITEQLKKRGLLVAAVSQDDILFKSLLKGRVLSIIAPKGLATFFIAQPGYASQLKILEKPITSVSYFVAVSKVGKLSYSESQNLWTTIAAIRGDEHLMANINSLVNVKLSSCYKTPDMC